MCISVILKFLQHRILINVSGKYIKLMVNYKFILSFIFTYLNHVILIIVILIKLNFNQMSLVNTLSLCLAINLYYLLFLLT